MVAIHLLLFLLCALLSILFPPMSPYNLCSRLSKGSPLDLWVIAVTPRRVCLITWNFEVYEMPASSLSIDAHSHQPTISLPLADAVPLKEKWPALYNKSHFTSYRFLVDYAFILADEKTDYLLIGPYGNGQANGFVYQLDTPKVSKLSLPMGAAVCLSSATSTGFLIRTQWKEPSLFWPFITTSPLTNSTVHLDPRVDATQIFKLCLLWGNGTSQSPEIYRTFVLDHACIHSAKWLISVAFQTAHFAYLIHVNGTVYIFDSRVLTHAGIEMKSKLIVSSLETFFKCPVPLPVTTTGLSNRKHVNIDVKLFLAILSATFICLLIWIILCYRLSCQSSPTPSSSASSLAPGTMAHSSVSAIWPASGQSVVSKASRQTKNSTRTRASRRQSADTRHSRPASLRAFLNNP